MELSRYMAIKYYRKLLSTQTLYFPRYDQFEDKLEGVMLDYIDPGKLTDQVSAGIRRISGTPQDEKDLVQTILRDIDPVLYEKFLQNFTFVSCWHRGMEESSLMWKTYAEKDKQGGIMIKSDLSSLTDDLTLERNSPRAVDTIFQTLGADPSNKYRISINFSEVRYLTLGTEINFIGLDRYLSKQVPYADEKEYRVVVQVGLSPLQRPNISLLLNEANVSEWNQKKMSDLIIEIRDKMIQSYNTQSSVLTGLLSNSKSDFKCKPHVKLPVDITSLIKEVVINPYGNVESDMREVQAINHEFGLSVPVKPSIIKTESSIPTTFFLGLPDGREVPFDY